MHVQLKSTICSNTSATVYDTWNCKILWEEVYYNIARRRAVEKTYVGAKRNKVHIGVGSF